MSSPLKILEVIAVVLADPLTTIKVSITIPVAVTSFFWEYPQFYNGYAHTPKA
jgi:hypothetical protein